MYQKFVTDVQKLLQERLGKQVKVEKVTALKNNDFRKIGLTFKEPYVNIAPNIYLEDWYLQYQNGKDLDSIVTNILSIYEKIKFNKSWNTNFLYIFDSVKDKLVMRLVNLNSNKNRLKELPYVVFHDLAIIFYVLMECENKESASVPVNNAMLDTWNIDVEELYRVAKENTRKILPVEFLPLSVVINQLSGKEKIKQDDNFMYMLSNKNRCLGASTILYDGVLEKIGDMLKTNFYILPSSIHEVLILPEDLEMSQEELNEMIEETNHLVVEKEEVLSNHAYYYDRAIKKLI